MSVEKFDDDKKKPVIEVSGIDLAFRPISVADQTPTGRQILAYCDVHPRDEYVVLQWLASGDVEELRPDETVDLAAQPGKFIVERTDRLFRLYLNDRSIAWPVANIPETALRLLGKVPASDELVIRKESEPDKPLARDSVVSLADVGVENIYSKPAKWELNVQGVVVSFDRPEVAVREALSAAGFDPDQGWIIVLKTRDQRNQVGIDDKIDLRSPGIEKLRLTPREINNGETYVDRRDFNLMPNDVSGLQSRNCKWETVIDNGRRWLFLKDVELPKGYDVPVATIAIEVPPSYPMAELDMFYCDPHLNRLDGKPIPQTQVTESIEGKGFQRWSRHRGAIAPWRAGVDSVLTHLTLIDAALLREVEES